MLSHSRVDFRQSRRLQAFARQFPPHAPKALHADLSEFTRRFPFRPNYGRFALGALHAAHGCGRTTGDTSGKRARRDRAHHRLPDRNSHPGRPCQRGHRHFDTFVHLAQTVLPDYIENTLMLGALVVVGVLIVGVPAAWLVASCEFPGRSVLEAALVLPLAAPAYVLGYAYADFLPRTDRCKVRCAARLGVEDWRVLVSRRTLIAGRGVDAGAGAVPVRLSAGARAVSFRIGDRARGRAHAGPRRLAFVLYRVAAAGAACAGRGRGPCADGDVRRLRHRLVFRRAGVFDRHLQRVVFVRRSGGGGATGRAADRVRRACACLSSASRGGGARYHEAGRRDTPPARAGS